MEVCQKITQLCYWVILNCGNVAINNYNLLKIKVDFWVKVWYKESRKIRKGGENG